MLRIRAEGVSALRCAFAALLAGCTSGGAPAASATGPEPASSAAPAPLAETGTAANDDPDAGIFTADQADRGRTAFDDACSDCHANSEFRGRTFQSSWGRRTVRSLYRTIRSTMPDDNPGALEEETYLDVVSYILSINGHSAGSSELAADSPMREVRLAPSGVDR